MWKKATCWTLVILGFSFGTLTLTALNYRWYVGPGIRYWLSFFSLAVPAFTLVIGSLQATTNKRKAASLLLVASAATLILTFLGEQSGYWWGRVIGQTVIVLIPGLLWTATIALGWPELLAKPKNHRGQAVAFFSAIILAAFLSISLPERYMGDCDQKSPFSSRQYDEQAVFTATITRVGWPYYTYAASWSIAKVEKNYWGTPSAGGFVLLHMPTTRDSFGKMYFVDSTRAQGFWTQFMPAIEWTPCTATSRIELAQPYVRAIENGPPKDGVRITGTVVSSLVGSGKPVPGVAVAITGPKGRIETVTDATGVFEVNGLPPGDYNLSFASSKARWPYRTRRNLYAGRIWAETLYIR